MGLALLSCRQNLQPGGQAGETAGQRHSGGKRGAVRLRQPPRHPGVVHLVHMTPGGQQIVGQAPLIGQQQQSLRILIQPAHRKEPLPAQVLRQQIQHGPAPAVLGGGEVTRRFIQHDPGVPPVPQRLAIDGDLRGLRVCLLLCRPGGDAVHQHPALPNQVFGLPPGPLPRGGDHLV